jgi:hypothetical protein
MIDFPAPNIALLPQAQTLVSTSYQPQGRPTTPVVVDNGRLPGSAIIPWGDANDFPQQILQRGRRSTILPRALQWQANLISGRIIPFQVSYDDQANEVLRYVNDQEINQFLTSLHFQRYQRESANDIFWFLNIFPELILSKDRRKITHIHPNEAAYCRWEAQNAQGVCEHVYINANWGSGGAAHSPETHRIRALDPLEYDLIGWTRERYPNTYKFIYPSSYPTPGQSFYQLAHWDGIRTSGWLDVLEKVPLLKKSLFENQMTIKYHIKIPREYWPNEYGKAWEQATPEQRDQIRSDKMRQLNERLIGAENAGVALATEFGVSAVDGKTIEGWSIEALPDKLKDGSYLADNMEATAHLLYAIGLDPTLVGFASKEMGSRSGGSDKRESMLIYLAQLDPYRDVMYEPLRFIADYNGWLKKYPNLEFRSKKTILTTLDTGAGTQETVE